MKITDAKDRRKAFTGQQGIFYTYYTLHSFEEGSAPCELDSLKEEVLVCNASRCSHYAEIDISRHGIVMFESGKGIGLSGLHIIIVRKDLIGNQLDICPDMMDYQKTLKALSVINTPFTLVVLSIFKQLSYFLSEGQTRKWVRNQLRLLKEEYQE